jgi:hypothetical protein
MARKKKNDVSKDYSCDCKSYSGCGGCTYGLGFIGAAIYYISVAPTFWMGVLGFFKALVWPAFLVYEVLRFVGS